MADRSVDSGNRRRVAPEFPKRLAYGRLREHKEARGAPAGRAEQEALEFQTSRAGKAVHGLHAGLPGPILQNSGSVGMGLSFDGELEWESDRTVWSARRQMAGSREPSRSQPYSEGQVFRPDRGCSGRTC